MNTPSIEIVAAIGRNRELGKVGKLLWYIPDDLKRFRRLTVGHPVIMGRKTFESILRVAGRPLPQRPNLVVTRDMKWKCPGVEVFHSLDEALERARELDKKVIFIGGGAEIYAQALPLADVLHLTRIDDAKYADTFFPPYESDFTKTTFDEAHEWNGIGYRWVDLERHR